MAAPIIDRLGIEKTSAPMILILGETGAGKSHFCNRVLGEGVEDVKESASLKSCTEKPELVSAKVDGREYLLVDTPGFNDTYKGYKRSDARILAEIAQALTLQTQLGVKLRGILYLYNISSTRMTGEALRQFELIQRICGEKNYQNVLLVTTQWPSNIAEQSRCAVREGELRRDFWSEMIHGGSTMCRFDDKHGSAKAIIRRLAAKEDVVLALQGELAGGAKLKETSAFSFMVDVRSKEEEVLAAERAEIWEGQLESIQIRKQGEKQLNNDIVADTQSAIDKNVATAREQKKKLTVRTLFSWILGLTHIAMVVTQVGLEAA